MSARRALLVALSLPVGLTAGLVAGCVLAGAHHAAHLYRTRKG